MGLKHQLKQRVKQILGKVDYILKPKSIILIYSLGKVGSSTVFATLKTKVNKYSDVFQTHFLSSKWLHNILPANSTLFHHHIKDGENILSHIKAHPEKKVKIITLVRDPISRNFSDILQNWEAYFGGRKIDEVSLEELSVYMKDGDFNYVLNWFDSEFEEYTGLSIYSLPFDRQKGYSFYKTKSFDILCIQLEKLNTCYNLVFRKFLNLDIKDLVNDNTGENKQGHEKIESLKKTIEYSDETLDKIYSSRYMTHFYSADQIKSFRAKWSGKLSKSAGR